MKSQAQNTINGEFKLKYPQINSPTISENLFGVTVEDKYRVLENTDKPEVQKWLKEEQGLSDSILKKISYRDALYSRLESAVYSSNIQGGFPRSSDKRVFFTRKFLKERIQKIFYKDELKNETEIFSTEKVNNERSTYNIDYFQPSFNGKYLIFAMSINGDEMSTLQIIDVDKKELLSESIERTFYGNPQWLTTNDGFFYSQLKDVKSEADKKTIYEDSKIKLHILGTSVSKDKEVFSRSLNSSSNLIKIDLPFIALFPNSDKVLVFIYRGTSSYLSLYYCSLNEILSQNSEAFQWRNICLEEEKTTGFALNNNKLYFLTFKENPNGLIKEVDLNDRKLKQNLFLSAKEQVFEDLIMTKQNLYLQSSKNGIGLITQIDLLNNKNTQIRLPLEGTVYLKPSSPISQYYSHSSNLYFTMESWNREISGYCYNPKLKKVSKTNYKAQKESRKQNDVVTKEFEIQSRDGIMIPVSLIYSKKTTLNGTNPAILKAYGAYGMSLSPHFDLSVIEWVKMGGIYVVAHVRGGGEKGDNWYKGGFKATKSNSWNDLIDCAEFLIKEKYTSNEKLGLMGISAGCITVGMAVVTRPDLFKAAILEVGILNSLRFENSKNNLNVSEFGTAKDSSEFINLIGMDVYHHIKKGVQYPSILITGELKDSRVDIWQPAKAAAKFQEVSEHNIILFKVKEYGHGGDIVKQKDYADNLSFLLMTLKHSPINLK